MGKIIKMKPRKTKKQTLKDLILHGKPYTIKIFHHEITFMSIPYKLKKQIQFFNEYWPIFQQSFLDLNPNTEFDSNYIVNRFNNLPQEKINSLVWQFSEIYAKNNKLTYSEFYELVEKQYSKTEQKLRTIK